MAKQEQIIHVCSKEKEIAELSTKVNSLMDIMKDNGHDGLPTAVTKLSATTTELKESVTELKTAINGFKMFQKEIEITSVKEKEHEADIKEIEDHQYKKDEQIRRDLEAKAERMKTDRKWLVTTVIALIVLLFGSGVWSRHEKKLEEEHNERMMYMIPINDSIMYFRNGSYQKFDSLYFNDSDNPLPK